MKIDGEYDFKWITLGKFMRQAEKLGLRGNFMKDVLRRQSKRLSKEAPLLAKQLNRTHPSSVYGEILNGIMTRIAQLGY